MMTVLGEIVKVCASLSKHHHHHNNEICMLQKDSIKTEDF